MRSDRRVHLAATPEETWATLERVDQYPAWWPWLRSFDGVALAPGERWSCTVKPPLPYQVTFDLDLVEVVPAASVAARVGGDIVGTARFDLVPSGGGTSLVLAAELAAASPWLRRLERWAFPIARMGHDQIIDGALAELARHVVVPA